MPLLALEDLGSSAAEPSTNVELLESGGPSAENRRPQVSDNDGAPGRFKTLFRHVAASLKGMSGNRSIFADNRTPACPFGTMAQALGPPWTYASPGDRQLS